MDFLKEFINESKQASSLAKEKLQKKWVRRGEKESVLEKLQSEEKESKKRKREEEEREEEKEKNEEKDEGEEDDRNNPIYLLSKQEVKIRLRDFNQPITLFGESDQERARRLVIVTAEKEKESIFKLDEGFETRNVFLGNKKTLKENEIEREEDDDDDDVKRGGKDEDSDNDSDDDRQKKKKKTGKDEEDEKEEDKVVTEAMYCRNYFKMLLKLWAADLAARPEEIKRSVQGRKATMTHKQCKDYIRPFFKLCKRNKVPVDILFNVRAIVRFCEEREYVKANDMYLKIAIGNSAWPIGVTSVGIHMRTGRERIQTDKNLHVMNNEQQRKYITNIRRLITYAQTKFPTDPSKMSFT